VGVTTQSRRYHYYPELKAVSADLFSCGHLSSQTKWNTSERGYSRLSSPHGQRLSIHYPVSADISTLKTTWERHTKHTSNRSDVDNKLWEVLEQRLTLDGRYTLTVMVGMQIRLKSLPLQSKPSVSHCPSQKRPPSANSTTQRRWWRVSQSFA
jgi:hypothetical protein